MGCENVIFVGCCGADGFDNNIFAEVRDVGFFDEVEEVLGEGEFFLHVFGITLALRVFERLIISECGNFEDLTVFWSGAWSIGVEIWGRHEVPALVEVARELVFPGFVHIPLLQVPGVEFTEAVFFEIEAWFETKVHHHAGW